MTIATRLLGGSFWFWAATTRIHDRSSWIAFLESSPCTAEGTTISALQITQQVELVDGGEVEDWGSVGNNDQAPGSLFTR